MSDTGKWIDRDAVADLVGIEVKSVNKWISNKGIEPVFRPGRGRGMVNLYSRDAVIAARDTVSEGRGNRSPRTLVAYGAPRKPVRDEERLLHLTPAGEAASAATGLLAANTESDGARFFQARCLTHQDGAECGFESAWMGTPYGAAKWWALHLELSNYTIKGRRS